MNHARQMTQERTRIPGDETLEMPHANGVILTSTSIVRSSVPR